MDTTATTLIAEGTSINGKIEMDAKLHVDGIINGDIHSTNIVTIGTTGKITGEIHANHLMVSGHFEGIADCENIDILAGGRVAGDIISNNLIIESQGKFEGTSKIRVEK
jgi:cytoskeletal protein CcmA (bactofilin family)